MPRLSMVHRSNDGVQQFEEQAMIGQVQEFVAERAALLFGRVKDARRTSVASARGAVRNSAETIKHLQSPMQTVAQSGIKLTAVTQTLSQNLIELQTEM